MSYLNMTKHKLQIMLFDSKNTLKHCFFKMTKLKNPGFIRFFIPRYQRQPPPPFQKSLNNAVILSPFYARCIPKPQPQFQNTKKYAVILSAFYARDITKPQPQFQPGIKRVKDLAELLRRPKSQAQATIACCLASPFSKKNPGQHAPTGIF